MTLCLCEYLTPECLTAAGLPERPMICLACYAKRRRVQAWYAAPYEVKHCTTCGKRVTTEYDRCYDCRTATVSYGRDTARQQAKAL